LLLLDPLTAFTTLLASYTCNGWLQSLQTLQPGIKFFIEIFFDSTFCNQLNILFGPPAFTAESRLDCCDGLATEIVYIQFRHPALLSQQLQDKNSTNPAQAMLTFGPELGCLLWHLSSGT
jgi:hypothetical protein